MSDFFFLVHFQEHTHRFNWKIIFFIFLTGFFLHGNSNKATEKAAILWSFTQIQKGILGGTEHKQLFQHRIYKTSVTQNLDGKHQFLILNLPLLATRAGTLPLSFSPPILISPILPTLQIFHVKTSQGDEYDNALKAEKSYLNIKYYMLLFLLVVSYWAV